MLAQVQLTRGNLDRSLWHQERALSLNPNDDRILCTHGEILTVLGRAAEGLDWVCKAMRLNPYQPQRYWTHRAHVLFHLERSKEAPAALANLTRPRLDDRVYILITNVMLGYRAAVADSVAELYSQFPEIDVAEFIESLPYTESAYRLAVAGPLKKTVSAESSQGVTSADPV